MNLPVEEIEEGLKEVLKDEKGVHKVAELLHYMLDLQEDSISSLQNDLNNLFKYRNN